MPEAFVEFAISVSARGAKPLALRADCPLGGEARGELRLPGEALQPRPP